MRQKRARLYIKIQASILERIVVKIEEILGFYSSFRAYTPLPTKTNLGSLISSL